MDSVTKKQKRKRKNNWFGEFMPVILLLIFCATIVLFWNNISWVTNGRVWNQIVPVPTLQPPFGASLKRDTEPKGHATTTGNIGSGTLDTGTVRRDMITIPKINITAPIITAKTDNNEVVHSLLDSGVVLYPGSIPFGKIGQTVILGHSAPTGWPKIKYDWVFSKINELVKGDMIVITYNYETRYYKVVGMRVVTPQEGVPNSTVKGNSLMIVSCWPPGKDLKRIVVEATITDN